MKSHPAFGQWCVWASLGDFRHNTLFPVYFRWTFCLIPPASGWTSGLSGYGFTGQSKLANTTGVYKRIQIHIGTSKRTGLGAAGFKSLGSQRQSPAHDDCLELLFRLSSNSITLEFKPTYRSYGLGHVSL